MTTIERFNAPKQALNIVKNNLSKGELVQTNIEEVAIGLKLYTIKLVVEVSPEPIYQLV